MNHTIHNRLGLVVIASLFSLSSWAEAPDGYYDAAIGKSGEALQKSLSAIISNATDVGYDGLWEVYQTTDRRPDGKVWEVDEFLGENEGLVVAEIELADENEPFARPAWLGEEVTGDMRYYNSYLSQNPYKGWK